jgi:hypothetical protein
MSNTMSNTIPSTYDFSAAVLRLYHILEYQAETGEAPTEEAVALHILRSASGPPVRSIKGQ